MNFFIKIRRLFSNTDKGKKAASVTFYPNQIIVGTYDFTTTGLASASVKLTKLPVDTSPDILGKTLRKHFASTEHDILHPRDSKAHKKRWEDYKTATGFKTSKETYQDARYVSCRMTETDITLHPNKNKYNRVYLGIPDAQITLPISISDTELGLELLNAREIAKG